MFGLLINPTPERDESLLGYLYRLGNCNGLWNGELVKLFKELTDEQVHEWLNEDVRPVSWHDVVTEIRTPKFNNQKVWSLANVKYCQVCLAAGFYWRELWDLTLYTTCTVHKVELLYECPGCQAKSTQKILVTKSCDNCGYPSLKAYTPATAVDKSKFWISVELEKRLRLGITSNSAGLDSLTYEQFHFLAVRFGVRALSCKYFMNMTVASMASRNVVPDLAIAAGQVLLGWPQTFHGLLTDLMELRASNLSWRLGSAFGRIYNDVYLSLTDRCYDFIRSEFERYVIQNWEGPLAMRNRRLSECTLLEHRWLPYNKAAQITGLPENFLRRMHLSGELDAREFSYSCGKTVAVVDIEEARRLCSVAHEPLNLRETSRLLYLSRKRIEQLIKAGILKIVGGSPHAGEKWLVDYASIVSLAPVQFLSTPSDDFITISQVAKHYLPTSGGLTELVMAIQSGEMPVFCRAESEALNVGKWLVSPNELQRKQITRSTSSQAKGMSVTEAAKMLGVKEEVSYTLVRLGRLRSEMVQCFRRPAHVVSLGAIQHFKRNYILAPEVAQILGISVINALFQLRKVGFLPVVGPSLLDAYCRQYVWRRSKKLAAYLTSTAKVCDLL
ncbi:TniQ family protein [Pseudomonas sp. Irchel s3h17]|uniref:TniQ family protein n=1 Tax=Pseudomonas sp. Irchel s3h17 TaxID=2009182 RepID=UPI000BA3C0CB|nr:TniQ family protein [Pseudomonas sp. Irchel s3h17]